MYKLFQPVEINFQQHFAGIQFLMVAAVLQAEQQYFHTEN